jgi:hypothetical protein
MKSRSIFRRILPLSKLAFGNLGLVALTTALACSTESEPDTNDQGAGGQASTGGTAPGNAGGAANSGGTSGAQTGGAGVGGVGVGGGGATASGGGGAETGGAPATGGALTAGAGGEGAVGGSGGTASTDACTTISGLEAEFPQCFTVQVANGLTSARTDTAVIVSLSEIQISHPDFNPNAFVVFDGATELESQSVDQAPKGSPDEIAFMADFGPSETKAVAVRYATTGENKRTYAQRAQAIISPKTGGTWSGDTYTGGSYEDVELLDLGGHIVHDYDYMRFEGPGWESDRVGYRTYADGRNAGDIFGKKLPAMVLHDIDYVNEDYSTMSSWGMDILKVGEALGIGALGALEGGTVSRIANLQNITIEVLESGPIVALLRITYVDWQTASGTVSVTADISITAGSRLSKVVAGVSGSLTNLCTGFAKHDGTTLIPAPTTTGWNFLANFGVQSLVPDDLGLAIVYHTSDLVQVTEDSINHVVVMSPADGPLTYYFAGAWVQEAGGVSNQSEFASSLQQSLAELDSPVVVTIL